MPMYINKYGYVFHDTSGHSGETSKTQWFLLTEITRSTTCRLIVGRTIWKSSLRTRMVKSTELGMPVGHFLITYTWEVLNLNATRTKMWLTNTEKVRIANFCKSNWKVIWWGTSHAKTWAWSDDKEGHAKDKGWANCTNSPLHAHFKKGRTGIDWRIAQSSLLHRPEMLVLARIGRPYILCSANKLARAVTWRTRACDKHLPRLISYIHQHEWSQKIIPYGKYSTALPSGSVPRLRLCWWPWRFESNIGVNLVNLRKPNVRSLSVGCVRNKLQSHTVPLNLMSFLEMQVSAWMVFSRSWSLGFGYWSFALFHKPTSTRRLVAQQRPK